MAITITAAELALQADIPATDATRLLPVATALVDRYAPAAPAAIGNEACVRWAAYSAGASHTFFGASPEVEISGIKLSGRVHGPAFRNCGAASILAPWRVRNAGRCE